MIYLRRHVVGHGVEEEDRKDTWLEDADHCVQQAGITNIFNTPPLWEINHLNFFRL